MKKGYLTFKFPAKEEPTSRSEVLIKTFDGDNFDFITNDYSNPIVELKDEDGNDITDQIKNLDRNPWGRRTLGWQTGKFFDDYDPYSEESFLDTDFYDTDEEILAADIRNKEVLVKAMHCDVSSVSNAMAETWRRLGNDEIKAGRFLHELFAACIPDEDDEEGEDDDTPMIYSCHFESDCIDYSITFKIEWEGDFDMDKLVYICAGDDGDEIFEIESLAPDVIAGEQILVSYIIYDGKMYECWSPLEVYYEGEERGSFELAEDLDDYDLQTFSQDITKWEIEEDG